MNDARRQWLIKTGALLALGTAGPRAFAQTTRAAAAGGARVVLLGQSVPLTGTAGEIGLAFAAGSRLAVSDFNERNAASGLQLKLLQLDDGYDANRAAANARTLLSRDKADMLFGFVGTASSNAGAEVATQQGSLLFAPFAASDTLRAPRIPTCSTCAPA